MESLIRDNRRAHTIPHPGWRLASPMSLRVVKRGPLLYLRRSILGPPGLSLYGWAFMIRQPGACASESGVGWAWPVSAGETWNFYAVTLCDGSLSKWVGRRNKQHEGGNISSSNNHLCCPISSPNMLYTVEFPYLLTWDGSLCRCHRAQCTMDPRLTQPSCSIEAYLSFSDNS